MLVANNHSTKKKALQGWGSLIDGLLFNPQSYGDKSFHWRLWRSCVTQGVRQHGGKTVPGAEQAQGWGGRRVLLQPGTGDEAGAGSGTEAAVGLGGQMDKFWGTALQKQSVWRGDGGMEPNLTTCSCKDREMLLPALSKARSNGIHTLPASPGPSIYLYSDPSGVPWALKYLFDSQAVFWNAPSARPS